MDNFTTILYKMMPDMWWFRKISGVIKMVLKLAVCYALALLTGCLLMILFGTTLTISLVTNIGFIIFISVAFIAWFQDKLSPIVMLLFIMLLRLWPAEISSDLLYNSKVGMIALQSIGYISSIMLVFGLACHVTYRSNPRFFDIIHEVQENLKKRN